MTSAENMSSDEVLRVKLNVLRREHRELDDEINTLQTEAGTDQLNLKRLKKRKLSLKDQITSIEDKLTPDIIA